MTDATAASGDALFEARDLCIGYGGSAVVRDLNLTIRPGDFWFLLGPNGAGKTTLLRTLLGLTPALAGVFWRHPQLGQLEHIGFVPQRCDLNPSLPTTIREFIVLGLVGLHLDAPVRRERLAWALERVGLDGLAREDYWSLSGGQRQRALLARALIRQPTVLVLDEPTVGLDPTAEDTLLQLLGDLNRADRRTLLLVTHDLGIAAKYATHVALFHDGNVVAGARREVLTRANLQRIYGLHVDVSTDPTNDGLHIHSIGGHP
jgi:ABC-type Mn2+/Zn2+ transport system ATPase subunit